MSNIILPSSPEDLKRIRGCMEEMSNSFTRMEAERDFQKEAINALAEECEIPKFHNQNVTDLIAEVSDIEALMESI
jgi:archaellum component FlaC